MAACLNLTLETIVSTSSFAALGGNLLVALQVVRSLYVQHHCVPDGRTLGGDTRTLDRPFWVGFLWNMATLGDYTEFLETSGVDLDHCDDDDGQKRVAAINSAAPALPLISSNANCLAESLQKTIVQGCTVAASELLCLVPYLLQRYSVPKHQQLS